MDKDQLEAASALAGVLLAAVLAGYCVFWGERAHRLLARNVAEVSEMARHQAAVAAMVPRSVYDPAEDL